MSRFVSEQQRRYVMWKLKGYTPTVTRAKPAPTVVTEALQLDYGAAPVWTFPSSSTPGQVYRVQFGEDGRLWCNCPGWIFSRGSREQKTCRHIQQIERMLGERGLDVGPGGLVRGRSAPLEERIAPSLQPVGPLRPSPVASQLASHGIVPAPGASRTAGRSQAARRAWATRRAQGWRPRRR